MPDIFEEKHRQPSRHILTEALEPLMEDIYEAVGVRVSFADTEENTLAQTEYQCDFCRRSVADAELLARCQACSREGKRRAKIAPDGIFFYRCWRGLVSAVIHVSDHERSLGYFIISGFVSVPERMAQTEQLFPAPDMQISEEEMKSIQFFHYEKIRDIIKTVGIAGRYLTESYRRRLAEEAQRQAEFRALQSQIGPHFLFNTLNSISQMALLEGAEQAPEAIYSLGRLLRRSMKQHTGLVPLYEELEFTREYMRIKQLLGHGNILYHEEIDPSVENVLFPAFTLQPMVENAVSHGLEPRPEGGNVFVTATREDGFVALRVIDDGLGFDPQAVKPRAGGEMTGIGIANVRERLRLFYGSKFEHRVISAPGQGTVIYFKVPETT